jgi:pimeloyl-ACP methyl ester carboxylesterase
MQEVIEPDHASIRPRVPARPHPRARDARERAVPLALAAGLRVNYTREGSGPPLLLLHGWSNSSLTLQPLAHALADTRTVIVPDLPGFGRTEAPRDPRGWDTATHAEWMAELLGKLKLDRADIFGHSHGGRIASYFAATSPERVERLILCCSAGLRLHIAMKTRLRRRGIRLLLRSAHTAARLHLLGRNGPERARALSERYASADYRAAGGMRPTLARVLADDLEPLLPRITAPTLIVWGENDRETPIELAERSHRLIRGSQLFVVPGTGHHVFAEAQDAVAGRMRTFLADASVAEAVSS